MKKITYYLLSLCLIMSLAACDTDIESNDKTDSQEVYDYRNERYQDFYSRYMRKTKKDHIIVTSEDIRQKLALKHVPDNIVARINIYRKKNPNKFSLVDKRFRNQSSILDDYNRDGAQYKECSDEYKEDNFFCIQDENHPKMGKTHYFYLSNDSIKMQHINHNFLFSCSLVNGETKCRTASYLNPPYNLKLTIHFTNLQNFFYIMPYLEQHFYEVTGEHVWQNLHKQN